MSAMLFEGDCLDIMPLLGAGAVDMVLTDPPYGTIKGLGDGAVDHGMKGKTEWDTAIDTGEVMANANCILRKNGRLILFAQHPYTTELINGASPNVPFAYSMVWVKDHFANALLAKKAPVSYYEDVLVFSKRYPASEAEFTHPLRGYFKGVLGFTGLNVKGVNAVLGHRKAEHTFYVGTSQFGLCTEETYLELIEAFGIDAMCGFKDFQELLVEDAPQAPSIFNLWEGKKYKSNILKYKKDYDGFHPTQKPVLLLEDLIKTYTNEGDTVLDFTMGSGTTGVACKNLNRQFIGIELDPIYYATAAGRILGA